MGEQPSDQNVERMDLGSDNADRLSAQVKAISVLSTGNDFPKKFREIDFTYFFSDFTVRAMQDEIKDINQQIEKENSLLATSSR